ncbi:MAG: PTS sugar transporter subunit IIA, partial [Rhodobiaceae bacterium]|nr:PTS sugar transporter subunit IIA [Rhodobiaceae bacterium]
MDISSFIARDNVLVGLRVSSKKQLLTELAAKASKALDLEERTVFDTLLQRERLGSTGMGNGIAIPHGKMPDLDGIFCMVARLDSPINFDAVDDQPVDLV